MAKEDVDHWGMFDRLTDLDGNIDRIVVKFNESAIEEIRMGRFNHALRITRRSPLNHPENPAQVENNHIHWRGDQIENRLGNLLGANSEAPTVLFAIRHGQGGSEYVPIFDSLKYRDNFISGWSALQNQPATELSRHRTLDILENFLPDYDERAIMLNRQAMEQFRNRGDDLAAEHEIEHILVGGTGRLKNWRANCKPTG